MISIGRTALLWLLAAVAGHPVFAADDTPSGPSYLDRRAGALRAQDTSQTGLARRAGIPDSPDKALHSSHVRNDDGTITQLSVSTSVRELTGALERAKGGAGPAGPFNAWVDARYADNRATERLGALYLGADYLLQPSVMVGTMVQIDTLSWTAADLDGVVTGTGYLVGPYASLRLAPDLFFDTRVAWGTADNEAELAGVPHDFATQRRLLRSGLMERRSFGAWRFTQGLTLSYGEESHSGPADPMVAASPGMIPAASAGRLDFGPGLAYRFALGDSAFVEPSAGLRGGWDFDRFGALFDGDGLIPPEASGTAELGVAYGAHDGLSLQATGTVDGLGRDDASAWAGRIRLNAPLN